MCLDVDKLAEEDKKYNLESNMFTFHSQGMILLWWRLYEGEIIGWW